ncbi:hypothetical protein KP509_01G080600 [Ceratopteris richardii]|uniref:DUF1997 family protein n=1 Tax=Ceratopteris richardii TaxID=49495 RepID=A0A8T2VI14_CERRI|nr:hypothetical protein KP509_01G080600 [Ceratopteris richardii]
MATKLTSLSLHSVTVRSPQHRGHTRQRKFQPLVTCQSQNATSFSSSLGTDLPLRQYSEVPFQSYLEDRQRVFQALFPDKKRCEMLNDKEWRIYMLPLDFFFLSVNPVIDMRIVVQPPSSSLPIPVSKEVEKVLTLEATRWELRGLGYALKPSDFSLNIEGILFSEKRGRASRLRGHLKMSVSLVTPPSLALIPEELVKSVGESVLTHLLTSMKEKVNTKLLQDYREYAIEKSNTRQMKQVTASAQ